MNRFRKTALHHAAISILYLCNEYETNPVLGDALLLTLGRLNHLPYWGSIPTEIQNHILETIRLSQISYLSKSRALSLLLEVAEDEGNSVVLTTSEANALDIATLAFSCMPSKNYSQVIEEGLSFLRALYAKKPYTFKQSKQSTIKFEPQSDLQFVVPTELVPTELSPIRIETRPELKEICISVTELIEHAKRLSNLTSEPNYFKNTVLFLESLKSGKTNANSDTLWFSTGELQLVIAPTGSGKSILTRVMSTFLLSKNISIAIVVPVVKDAINEYKKLSSFIELLGLNSHAGLLFSHRKLGTETCDELTEALSSDEASRDQSEWVFKHLAYFCQLSAYEAEEKTFEYGDEPCTQSGFTCPFMAQCGKFNHQRNSAKSQLIFINHHSYLVGRLKVPMVDRHENPINTIQQLIAHRAQLVLIDEVDLLQKNLIGLDVGSLSLTKNKGPTVAGLLSRELEDSGKWPNNFGIIEQLNTLELSAKLLREAINSNHISWPKQFGYLDTPALMTVSLEKMIHFRFKELAPNYDDNMLGLLFDNSPIPDNPQWENLRVALEYWNHTGAYVGMSETVRRKEVSQALDTLLVLYQPKEKSPPAEIVDKRKKLEASIKDRLIGMLVLHRMFNHLQERLRDITYQIGSTDLRASDYASEFYSQLIGYKPFSISPLGPLGGRYYGFQLDGKEKRQQLSVISLSGDPHQTIAHLGNFASRSICGIPRTIIGLSATAWFPGATSCDVSGSLAFYIADETKKLHLYLSEVFEQEKVIKVSGTTKLRMSNLYRLAQGLWCQTLESKIQQLKQSKPERARVMLVTGSHSEAEEVTKALTEKMGEETALKRIRFLVSNSYDSSKNPKAIKRNELADFAHSDADILISCFSSVARGHNILQPGSAESAISAIYVLVRPVPHFIDPSLALAHVSYNSLKTEYVEPASHEILKREQKYAHISLRQYYNEIGPIKLLTPELKMEYFCNVLVELLQLAGRGRRGGTDIAIYLVDGAFHDQECGWAVLIKDTLDIWKESGHYEQMKILHGALINALERFII
ncbi:hypothetical protein [Pseudoalteromonas maricaloris]|uniref:hypothetical protein n=1 Tax=Pseudoalteromonas maricaloris TaxID=184924 RepID=UPI003C165668